MDDIRKPLSKLKEFKHRVGGGKRGPSRVEVNTAEERVGSPASLLRPDSRVEGGTFSMDVSQACSRDPSPHPELATADEDRLDDPQRKRVDVDEKEVRQSLSRLEPDVQNATGSGPGQEVKQTSSPPSITPIAPKQESDSTWTFSPQQPCLITLLDNAETPAVTGRVQGDPRRDKNAEPSTAANEKKSSWKSTAFATTKLLLRGVRDSADAFGPLKSVAGGLCFILENCEVRPSPCPHCHNSYLYLSE